MLNREAFHCLINNDMLPYELCSESDQKYYEEHEADGNPLPDTVFKRNSGAYVRVNVSSEELRCNLLFCQTKFLKTIRNCCVILTAIAITSVIFAFFR